MGDADNCLEPVSISNSRNNTKATHDSEPCIYVFKRVCGGFIIVTADDVAEDILAYSDYGSLDMNILPDNLRIWLEGKHPVNHVLHIS